MPWRVCRIFAVPVVADSDRRDAHLPNRDGAARSGAQADRFTSPVLLQRNVLAAVDDGAERGGVDARFAVSGVFHGGIVVEAGGGFGTGGGDDGGVGVPILCCISWRDRCGGRRWIRNGRMS